MLHLFYQQLGLLRGKFLKILQERKDGANIEKDRSEYIFEGS